MSPKPHPLSEAAVAAALKRLEDFQLLSAGDLGRLRALAARIDRESRRLPITAETLAEWFPDVTESGREQALKKLVHRLKQAQDVACETQRLNAEQTIELKIERKKDGVLTREAWFLGAAAPKATARLDDLDDAYPLYENRALPRELSGRPAKGAEPILLLTVNAHERAALHACFLQDRPARIVERDDVQYECLGYMPPPDGKRGPRRPIIAYECRMGSLRSGAALSATAAAIRHFSPALVIAVGIGFGADREKQRLGDVMVSEQVATYESERHNKDDTHVLRTDIQPAALDWLKRAMRAPHAMFGLHKGLMLCGEKLLDNRDEHRRLMTAFPTAVGGDMESYGVSVACADAERKVGWLVIKGISDWGDGTKAEGEEARKDALQRQAADNAALVAYFAIHRELPASMSAPVEALAAGHAMTPRRGRARIRDVEDAGSLFDNFSKRLSQQDPYPGPSERRNPPAARPAESESEAAEAIHQVLLRWLENPDGPPLFAVLGEYGMGKTVTCQRLYRELSEAREAGGAPSWMRLPVYLDLRESRSIKSQDRHRTSPLPRVDAFIDDLFANGWRVEPGESPPTCDDLRRWLREGALLILDGLDECLVHLDENQHGDLLRMLLSLLTDALPREERPERAPHAASKQRIAPRLLVSCRTNFFKTLSDQRNLFTGYRRGKIDAEWYESRVLLPLNDAQIQRYLETVVPTLPIEQTMRLVRETHNLGELAQRPMTLKLLAEYIPELEAERQAGAVVNGAALYGLVAKKWLQRDEGKHHLRPEHKLRMMPALAAHLWRSGVRRMPYDELHRWFHEWRRGQPDLAELYSPTAYHQIKLEEDLRTATFIIRQDSQDNEARSDAEGEPGDGEGFRFAHSSLAEYFLAVFLAEAVRNDRPDDWAMAIPSVETLDFLAQRLELDQASLPAARRRESGLSAVLNAWRTSYRAQASELLLRYALHARAMPLQLRVMPELAGFDLRNAQLRGWRFGERRRNDGAPLLDLSRIRWAGADLRETYFAHVRLDDGDFSGARLDMAAFQHGSAQRCDWRNSDLLGTVFRHMRFDGSHWRPLRQCHRPKVVACSGADALTGALHPPQAFVGGPSGPTPIAPHPNLALPPTASPTATALAALPPRVRAAIAGQGGTVWSVALSADGGRVVSASEDGTVRVWDALSGECVRELRGHTRGVTSVALSADGGRVVSGSDDGTVRVWDALSGECVRELRGHTNWVRSVAVSADGGRVVSVSEDGTVRVWDALSGECVRELRGPRGVKGVAVSADGGRVVSGSEDGTVRVWDALSGESLRELRGHTRAVTSVALSADGGRVVSGSYDGTVRVWDALSGECVRELRGHMNWVLSVALSAEGGRAVSGSEDGTVRVWDALSGECVCELRGHTRGVNGVALSADGGRVVSGSDDGTVRGWDALSGECVCELRGHTDWVRSVALSADGGRVVSGSDDVTVRVWDALSGECVRELRGHTNWVRSVALSAEGGRVVSGSDDGTVRCFSGMGGRAETLACTWIAAVGSPDDIPSYASWRPGLHAANAEGPLGAMSSSQADSQNGKQQMFGPEGPPTTAVDDAGLPTDAGDVLISASGDAWRLLSWDVEDPNEPSGWRRVPLQAYE